MARTSNTASHNAAVLARINGAKAKSTSTAKPETPQPQAAHIEEETAESLYASAREYMERAFGKLSLPSWTRRIVSTIIGITMSAVVSYGCLSLLDMLVFATAVYTGSQFLTFVVLFLGFVLTMMATMTAASKVYEACMQFEYSNVKARVSGWFGGFKSAPAR